jgi:hypothetical protein
VQASTTKSFVDKEKNPKLKVSIAIGGPSEESRKYSNMAATPINEMDQVKCLPCINRLKSTQWQSKKRLKRLKAIVSFQYISFNIFSQQIANDLGEHRLSGAVPLARKISQFQRELAQKYFSIANLRPLKFSIKR